VVVVHSGVWTVVVGGPRQDFGVEQGGVRSGRPTVADHVVNPARSRNERDASGGGGVCGGATGAFGGRKGIPEDAVRIRRALLRGFDIHVDGGVGEQTVIYRDVRTPEITLRVIHVTIDALIRYIRTDGQVLSFEVSIKVEFHPVEAEGANEEVEF